MTTINGVELSSSSNRRDYQSIANGTHTNDDNTPTTVSLAGHIISTAGLCLCTLMQAYLLISVFPYAGYMVVDLMDGVNEENAGTYAGLIASSFMAGRTLSAYYWGVVADIYGRIFVLNASLLLSACFSILFGTSQTFAHAMAWRFCLGLAGGIVSTAKTAVTELAHGNERLERRAMGLVVGMRGWGFLISPAVGGILAEPLQQYPNAKFLQGDGLVRSLLSRYRWLLPNLVGAFFCLLTAIIVALFVEETLPAAKLRSPKFIASDLYHHARQRMGRCPCAGRTITQSSRGESQLLVSQARPGIASDKQSLESDAVSGRDKKALWRRTSTRRHLIPYCIFSFFVVAVDESFPLFCISRRGGLGLAEAAIGKILSGAGLLFALCQYVVFVTIVNRFGLYPSIAIGSWMGVGPVLFLPLSTFINKGVTTGVSWDTYWFLSIMMAVSKIFTNVFFTSMAIALNKTVPSSQRATMNGLVMVLGSVAKGLGPTFAGALVAFSLSSGFIPSQYGSIVIFGVIAIFGFTVFGEVLRLESVVDSPQGESKQPVDQIP